MDMLDTILSAAPVIPVLTIDNLDDALPLCRALVAGGLPVLEITLRTECALAAIALVAAALPEAYVGAGTVLTPEDGDKAIAAGARFLVSPGATPELLAAGKTWSAPLLPGVATASEVMRCLAAGYIRLKFFPAEVAGGVAALKAYAGPLSAARFCATGGITPENAASYLAQPNIACVGGSWMMPKAAIAAGDWDRIEILAGQAAKLKPAR